VQTQNGDIVYNANALRAGDVMTIQLARGRVIGTVNHTETE
jgi:exonuclease VII large subunit